MKNIPRKALSLVLALAMAAVSLPAFATASKAASAAKSAASAVSAAPSSTSAMPPMKEPEPWVDIKDAAGLAALAQNPAGRYRLIADISLWDTPWTPFSFSGALDGAGHTIYDLKITQPGAEKGTSVDGNAKKYDTAFAGLFSITKNATIENLNVKVADVRITTDQNCFAAILAGYTENTKITNCKVEGRVYLALANKMGGVGGLTGFGNGTVSGCTADVTLVFVDQNPAAVKCEQFLGGIVASGYTDIENCTVEIKGYASIHGYAHNGGLVGMHYIHNPADKTHKGYVRNNTVNGYITFFENNKDRRAYCAAYVGEVMNWNMIQSGNKGTFKRDERIDYSKTLLPCEGEGYTPTVTAPTCTEMGFTTYKCNTGNYSYVADYIFPSHKPGPYEVVKAPTDKEEGVLRSTCTVCGQPAGEATIAKLSPGSDSIFAKPTLALSPGKSQTLTAPVTGQDGAPWPVVWSSSDEKVAAVDSAGKITALAPGTTTITAADQKGQPLATSSVIVQQGFPLWVLAPIGVLGLAIAFVLWRRAMIAKSRKARRRYKS